MSAQTNFTAADMPGSAARAGSPVAPVVQAPKPAPAPEPTPEPVVEVALEVEEVTQNNEETLSEEPEADSTGDAE